MLALRVIPEAYVDNRATHSVRKFHKGEICDRQSHKK